MFSGSEQQIIINDEESDRISVLHHGRRKRGEGTGGRVPRSRKISGDAPPPRYYDISLSFFLDTYANFTFSNIFKIK